MDTGQLLYNEETSCSAKILHKRFLFKFSLINKKDITESEML
jgi:hypothetical protein